VKQQGSGPVRPDELGPRLQERLDGDEMAADADDGDAGHYSRTYMSRGGGTVAGWNSQDLVSPTAVSAPGDLVVWRLR
jgi:hypothetical protein